MCSEIDSREIGEERTGLLVGAKHQLGLVAGPFFDDLLDLLDIGLFHCKELFIGEDEPCKHFEGGADHASLVGGAVFDDEGA